MGKLLKILGWLIGILVILVVALVVLVPMFVDPNEHKDRIVAEVKKATGRDLTIAGDIGLSVFPWLGLELNGLSLSNASGFGDKKFASVDLAKVRVKLMPLLLERTLEADTVQIEGLDLNLAKSKQGTTNWDDLSGQHGDMQDEADELTPAETSDSRGLAAFTIGGVAIQDAHVVWDDQSTGQHYEIKDLQFKTGPLTPGRAVDINLELGLESQQPVMQGRIDLSGSINSKPEQQYFSLETLRVNLRVTGEGLPDEGVDAKLAANVYLDQANGTFDVKDFNLTSGDLALRASVQGQGLDSTPTFTGNLKLDEFNPREWMQQFGLPVPDTSDPEVLKKLSLSSNFNGTTDLAALDKLAIQLDDTRIKGDLELLNLANPTYKFNLDIDQIDLDRYLPPQAEETEKTPTPAKPGKEEPLFPVETLRKLNLDGSLRVNSLTVNKIKAKAIQLKVTGKDGKLKIDQQVGRFYDGLIKGGIGLDVRGKTPVMTIDQEASRILAGPLLKDLTDTDKLDGSGGFKANLRTSGQTVSQLKRGLNGDLNFSFVDGAVKGINLAKMIREAKAKLSGETVAVTNEPDKTDFSEMSGSAVFKNGILTNRDLLAKSPYLRVDGSGKVNLVMENLDYTIRPVIVSTAKGQGGEGLEELVGVPIPVHFEGPWSKPKWNIDLAKVLQEKQKARLKEELDKKIEEKLPELQEKLPDDLKDKLPGALKGLF